MDVGKAGQVGRLIVTLQSLCDTIYSSRLQPRPPLVKRQKFSASTNQPSVDTVSRLSLAWNCQPITSKHLFTWSSCQEPLAGQTIFRGEVDGRKQHSSSRTLVCQEVERNVKDADETLACVCIVQSSLYQWTEWRSRQNLLPSLCDSPHFGQSVSICPSLVIVTHDAALIQSKSSLRVLCHPSQRFVSTTLSGVSSPAHSISL